MRRIIVELSFVSGILFSAYTIISIPDMVRQLINPVGIFPIPESSVQVSSKEIKNFSVNPVLLYRVSYQLKFTAKEMDCLAKNIFFESATEDHAGKLAVAQVTYNRLKDGRWGDDICKVVYARAQFSWTLDQRKMRTQPHGINWEASQQAARDFESGKRVDRLRDSLHYHADWIRAPKWAKSDNQVHKIGQHVFYASIK
jgi:spore germination cell wall hydrolase CwlJ-like protein